MYVVEREVSLSGNMLDAMYRRMGKSAGASRFGGGRWAEVVIVYTQEANGVPKGVSRSAPITPPLPLPRQLGSHPRTFRLRHPLLGTACTRRPSLASWTRLRTIDVSEQIDGV